MSLLASCSLNKKLYTNFNLFQTGLDSMGKVEIVPVVLKEKDMLDINFITEATLMQDQTSLVNLLNKNDAYTIDTNGELMIPTLGKVKAAGLTTKQLSDTLARRSSSFIKNPFVSVKLKSIKVIVLGEARRQAIIDLKPDRADIVNLLAELGGVTEMARRDSVLIIRQEGNGLRKPYYIDLRNANFYQSPVFNLQQNDVIYLKATNQYLRQLYLQSKTQELQKFQSVIVYLTLLTSVFSTYFLIRTLVK